MKQLFLGTLLLFIAQFVQSQNNIYVDGSGGGCGGNSPCFTTIQAAVDAASSGDIVNVYPGTYTEMVRIRKPLTLRSTGGKDVTTLQWTTPGGYVAPLCIEADNGSYSGVTIGGADGHGFTILGADVPNTAAGGGSESAAIFIGSNSANTISNITISYNTITPNGDGGLLTYYKGTTTYSNIIVSNNVFNGKTYVGTPVSGGLFDHGNVPRYPMAINSGTDNFTFTKNIVTSISGETVGGTEIGRSTIWAEPGSSSFTENYFAPTLARDVAGILIINGNNDIIECNYFSLANATSLYYLDTWESGVDINHIAAKNTFVGPGGIINGMGIVKNTAPGNPGTAANSNNPASGCNEISLPVVFNTLNANVVGTSLQVEWATSKEVNVDYFEVQASKNGKDFTTIAKVQSKATDGNSASGFSYSFSQDINTMNLLGLSVVGIGLLGILFHRKRNRTLMLVAGICVLMGMGIGCSTKQDSLDIDNGKLYIRILQKDKDGGEMYSKVVTATPR